MRNFFKKNTTFSNPWLRHGINLILISLVINHLAQPQNFPFTENYRFPWFSIFVSIGLGAIILGIAEFNFRYYRRTYFVKEVTTAVLLRFLFSTLGYITLFYIPLYYSLTAEDDKVQSLYYLLLGLLITLLLSTIFIAALFANAVYKLHQLTSKNGKLKVKHGGKICFLQFSEIALFYSENKVVYVVMEDGTSMSTDFTLNTLENQLQEKGFFRANRKTLLHPRAIALVKSAENGKLIVELKPILATPITPLLPISRYKKQEFLDWFEYNA